MTTKLKQQEKGFTIIEVLIVLAIAGLIILIVFLAVPALQRNSRNTQRTNDASAISSAVNECLTNKNGVNTRCNTIGGDEVPLDVDKISQLKTAANNLTNVTFCGDTGNACGGAAPALTGTAAWTEAVEVRFGAKCNQAGDTIDAGPTTPRQYAVLYEVENAGGNGLTRCIDS